MEGEKRYCLLQAAGDSDYVKKMYGGYLKVFESTYGKEGDVWDSYKVMEGEFPDVNELEKYDGFVVSGSTSDAYGNDYWIIKLCLLLQTLDAMEKKILGICFGHQVVCRALGGKVGRSTKGWDIGVKRVKIVEEIRANNILEELGEIPDSLSLIQCHQDEILELPLGAQVIASSDKTGVEVFTLNNHILGIQGHPEYNKDILYHLIERLQKNNAVEDDIAEAAKVELEKSEPDREYWERICRNFLKGRL